MNSSSKSAWNPSRLDVRAFAQASQFVERDHDLAQFARLNAEALTVAGSNIAVKWDCQGEMRPGASGHVSPWLHLRAKAVMPLRCQRCLGVVKVSIEVDRWFRFVADEATAELEDEDCEEDVLALEPRPDIGHLVEDELLMELPLVPMHVICPVDVPMQAGNLDLTKEAASHANPFAQLVRLKK